MKEFAILGCIACLSFYSIAIFHACRDQYPQEYPNRDAAQLEGLWRAEMHPHRFWHFSDGVLHQQVFDFNVLIVEHWYGYETRADSLFLREMLEPDERQTFTVAFETDSTAILTDIESDIQLNYKLKRF